MQLPKSGEASRLRQQVPSGVGNGHETMTPSPEPSNKAAMREIRPASRILVARLDAMGDCVLSSSFFRGLRRLFPRAEITGALPAKIVQLFDAGDLFDRILPLPPNSPEAWP